MAKVTGPMMSLDARGKFAGALVFSNWKGRPTVRQLVIPSNPQTLNQQNQRNYIRAAGKGQHWVKTTLTKITALGQRDQVLLTAAAPSGQAWNGFLVKSYVGAGDVNAIAAAAAWTATAPGDKTAWNTAAAALSPPIPAVAQKTTFGVSATALTAGNVYYLLQYALFVAGVHPAAPSATTPPTYV